MKVPLVTIPTNGKFKNNNIEYTVLTHERSMVEVYGNGRLWAWPTNTGKEQLEVELIKF